MSTENNFNNKKDDGLENADELKIKVNHGRSSLAEFTKRKLPDEKQLNDFEEFVEGEAKEEEIDVSLNEIYQDDKGGMVDVQKLDIKRKHGFIFWFISMFLLFSGLAVAAYAGYTYYLKLNSDITAMDFKVEGKNEITVGEEFIYSVLYKNNSQIAAKDGRIEIIFPEHFILLESTPVASEKNNIWKIGRLEPFQSGDIKIKGKIIGVTESTNIILASLTYMPVNFSSEFKKDATLTTYIQDLGLDINYDYFASSLVGEANDLNLKYNAKENNFINNFRITIGLQENIDFLKSAGDSTSTSSPFYSVRPGVWQVNEITREEKILPIKFKFNKKVADTQKITIIFEQAVGSSFYKFLEKTVDYEVMKSDLNLTLIINGSREDSGVDFGATLNYSIVYNNKGETDMKDVVIMAVLASDFLDWSSLDDKQNGQVRSNTISWTKDEIPGLAQIVKNQEGTIDFSIKVSEPGEIDPSKEYQVKSYSQFTIGNKEEFKESPDNKSNTIINKIKSDLKLDEQVRYFSQDNIPVGIGPNPPKTQEKTTYKVYWKLSNTLHELNDLESRVKLPAYLSYEARNQTTIGSITFDENNREVIWHIGRLPVTTFQANAEFNVGLTPAETDKNKILVILPGTKTTAVDTVSKANLEYTTKAKTTKLEDDEIGANDGMVQ